MSEINPYDNIDYDKQRGAFGVLAMAVDLDKEAKEFSAQVWGPKSKFTSIFQIADFQERMQSAFSLAVVKITLDAIAANKVVSLPTDPTVSLNHIMPIVFGAFVGLSIERILKGEQITVDVPSLFGNLTQAAFLLRPEQQQKQYLEIAIATFQKIARAGSDNVAQWSASLDQLTRTFVLAYRQHEPETRALIDKAYAGLLKTLLGAIEPA